jgi:transposase
MEVERSRKRRRYSSELKAQIMGECEVHGASVAKVAMSHGINANILHGWRKLARQGEVAIDVVQRDFVPVAVAPPPEVRVRDERIEVELRRGTLTMKIAWPMSAAADLAAWTRELLR